MYLFKSVFHTACMALHTVKKLKCLKHTHTHAHINTQITMIIYDGLTQIFFFCASASLRIYRPISIKRAMTIPVDEIYN